MQPLCVQVGYIPFVLLELSSDVLSGSAIKLKKIFFCGLWLVAEGPVFSKFPALMQLSSVSSDNGGS